MYILKDEWGHLLHEYIGTVTGRQRYHLLSAKGSWIDLRHQSMLESLDVLLREQSSWAATFHLVAAPVQLRTWLFSIEWV